VIRQGFVLTLPVLLMPVIRTLINGSRSSPYSGCSCLLSVSVSLLSFYFKGMRACFIEVFSCFGLYADCFGRESDIENVMELGVS